MTRINLVTGSGRRLPGLGSLLALTVAAAVLVGGGLGVYHAMQIREVQRLELRLQAARKQLAQARIQLQELKVLDEEEQALDAHAQTLAGLRGRRWSAWMSDLRGRVPAGVNVQSARAEGSVMRLLGSAGNLDDLARMAVDIQSSDLVHSVKLVTMQAAGGVPVQFEFQVTLKPEGGGRT